MKVTKEMLTAALNKAVQVGLLPEQSEASAIAISFGMIETVIKAALMAGPEKPKETPEELKERLLDHMRTPEQVNMVLDTVDRFMGVNFQGMEYEVSMNKESLTVNLKVPRAPEYLRQSLMQILPVGVLVEVEKS